MTKVQELFAETITVRSYSGRGMSGKKCLAIVGSAKECQRAIAYAVDVLVDEIVDGTVDENDPDVDEKIKDAAGITISTNRKLIEKLIAASQTDSMGLDIVMYWTDITYEEEFTEDDQDLDDEE